MGKARKYLIVALLALLIGAERAAIVGLRAVYRMCRRIARRRGRRSLL